MTQRTTYPMVTGNSVVALKYAGGVLVATDSIACYGSLKKYDDVKRVAAVGVANDTLLAAGGDYSDFQQMLKMIDARATSEYTMDDGASMSPSMLHQWLTRIMYQRRSKMDPLWNTIVVAGVRDGKSYLGTTDKVGTMYTDDIIATGMGAMLALPLLRKSWRPDLSEAEATKLLTDAMTVLNCRDKQSGNKINIGKVDATSCTVSEPIPLQIKWDYPEFVRGGGHLGDGSW